MTINHILQLKRKEVCYCDLDERESRVNNEATSFRVGINGSTPIYRDADGRRAFNHHKKKKRVDE